jgi:hypothetical protein
MKMILRWFPGGDDSVKLQQIRQTPGISGVATCFTDIPVGEVWPLGRLLALKETVQAAGLEMEVRQFLCLSLTGPGAIWPFGYPMAARLWPTGMKRF